MNFMTNATFCGYTYISVAASQVSWTDFTLSTGINMTVQHRAAVELISVSQPPKFLLK